MLGHIAGLSHTLLLLAPTTLLRAEIPDAIRSLISCSVLHPPAVFADALIAIASMGMGYFDPLTSSVVKLAVRVLRAAVKNSTLSPPTFSLIFPVLKFALTVHGVDAVVHDDALDVLAAHVDPCGSWPRAEMIGVLLHVMLKSINLRESAKTALLELCTGLEPFDISQLLDGCLSEIVLIRVVSLDALAKIVDIPGNKVR